MAEPSVVVDCVAYQPADVRQAASIFDNVDGYVYISSGDTYRVEVLPKCEGQSPLQPCTEAEGEDQS